MSSSLEVQTLEQTFEQTPVGSPTLLCFNNQISGHSCLLKGSTNPKYILKPFNPNEADFYEFFSKHKEYAISRFIPSYYGTLNLPKPDLEHFAEAYRDSPPTEEYEDLSTEVDIDAVGLEHQDCTLETEDTSTQSKAKWFKNLVMKRFNESDTSRNLFPTIITHY